MSDELINTTAVHKLLNAIGGDVDDFRDFIQEFVTTTPDQVDTMKRACKIDDMDALRIASHSLKSNARDFGATLLSTQCEILEQQCRNKNLNDASAQVAQIEASLEAASIALTELEL